MDGDITFKGIHMDGDVTFRVYIWMVMSPLGYTYGW